MKKYQKTIILASALLLIIVLITLAMIFDVDLFLFKNLSIAGIQSKHEKIAELTANETKQETNYVNAKSSLDTSKDNYSVAKETYENIDESTISIVQDATKDEKYFIEYLWVVLGNYAKSNKLSINIITPGSTAQTPTTTPDTTNNNGTSKNNTNNNTNNNTKTSGAEGTNNTKTDTTNNTTGTQTKDVKNTTPTNVGTSVDTSVSNNAIKITVKGRYSNVADFVFDVENDKSLKFKLDNIKMTYSGNNSIEATFNVLSLSVLK